MAYFFFPEEQDPNIVNLPLEDEKQGGVLYIRRNGFNFFLNAINTERAKIFLSIKKTNPEIYKLYLSGEIDQSLELLKNSNHISSFLEILADFHEIVSTVNMLGESQRYLEDIPDIKTASTSLYIRYHLSNYFNEFFILMERIDSLSKTISRLYRKDKRFQKLDWHLNNAKTILSNLFKETRRARNFHVHEKRYTDQGLEKLEAIEFNINFNIGNVEDMNSLFKNTTKENQERLLKIIETTNSDLAEILDIFFGVLHRIVFSKDNNFLPPNIPIKKTS